MTKANAPVAPPVADASPAAADAPVAPPQRRIRIGLWGLKLVLKASQIAQPNPTMCATDGCGLVACCAWASNLAPEEPWYSCLDCQENDFGGWPEKASDVPLETVPDDLREAMVDKCTRLAAPAMPDLPASLAPKPKRVRKRKRCSVDDCDKFATKGGKCTKCGGTEMQRKRCSVNDCDKFATKGGKCAKCGGTEKQRKRCSVDDCEKFAQTGGKCYRCGGGPPRKRRRIEDCVQTDEQRAAADEVVSAWDVNANDKVEGFDDAVQECLSLGMELTQIYYYLRLKAYPNIPLTYPVKNDAFLTRMSKRVTTVQMSTRTVVGRLVPGREQRVRISREEAKKLVNRMLLELEKE